MKSRLIQETVPYDDAAELLDCGKTMIYYLCKSGELVSTMHAGKRRIYIQSIEEYSARVKEKALKEARDKRGER